ncbi:hypothetical protein ACSCBZ_33055 [Streptomyces niveiscabiei]|uniref:Uncharacterized protein n=1 Tax=Streptomyces niveiscabiei TaxID=164115 RepID=A0ABW9HWC1_9ACTN|nr:hypothetical protein [Streptomyces sp. V2]
MVGRIAPDARRPAGGADVSPGRRGLTVRRQLPDLDRHIGHIRAQLPHQPAPSADQPDANPAPTTLPHRPAGADPHPQLPLRRTPFTDHPAQPPP